MTDGLRHARVAIAPPYSENNQNAITRWMLRGLTATMAPVQSNCKIRFGVFRFTGRAEEIILPFMFHQKSMKETKKTTPMTPRERARRVAESLFTNGVYQRAERLVLMSEDGRDLGGWGVGPIADRIEQAIAEAAGAEAQILQARIRALEARFHGERFERASMSSLEKDRKRRNEKADQLGAGAWFRKADFVQALVDVTFYPRTQLWITIEGRRRKIEREELERDYARLRL